MNGKWSDRVRIAALAAFAVFLGVSALSGHDPGIRIARTFGDTLLGMMRVLPCAFLLIGLFDVWVKRETVERHFGQSAGWQGYLWGVLLAGMSVGGLVVAFPIACALYRKGARLSVIFAYVGFCGLCRIPMTMFEVSFMGVRFTAVRLAVSLPLVLVSSMVMGRVLERRGYRITE